MRSNLRDLQSEVSDNLERNVERVQQLSEDVAQARADAAAASFEAATLIVERDVLRDRAAEAEQLLTEARKEIARQAAATETVAAGDRERTSTPQRDMSVVPAEPAVPLNAGVEEEVSLLRDQILFLQAELAATITLDVGSTMANADPTEGGASAAIRLEKELTDLRNFAAGERLQLESRCAELANELATAAGNGWLLDDARVTIARLTGEISALFALVDRIARHSVAQRRKQRVAIDAPVDFGVDHLTFRSNPPS